MSTPSTHCRERVDRTPTTHFPRTISLCRVGGFAALSAVVAACADAHSVRDGARITGLPRQTTHRWKTEPPGQARLAQVRDSLQNAGCVQTPDAERLVATTRHKNRTGLIGRTNGWKAILNTLTVHYGDRIADHIK